jgi:hypothetical protein
VGIGHDELRDVRLQQVIQPGSPGASLKGDVQASAQPLKKLNNGPGLGFDDAFHQEHPWNKPSVCGAIFSSLQV